MATAYFPRVGALPIWQTLMWKSASNAICAINRRVPLVLMAVGWTELAEEFVLFLQAEMLKSFQLQEVMKHIRLGQLCVLALWWAYLKPGKGSIRRPSTLTTVVLDKKQYTPVDAVMSPEIPYFATVPLLGPAVITAPRECQLCGAGFINWRALANHCTREHGGFIEYRKRLFWEA